MTAYLINALYILLQVMKYVVLAYLIFSWLPVFPALKRILTSLAAPLLYPVQWLLRHSIIYIKNIDISPIVVFIIIDFLSQQCFQLLANVTV